MAFVLYKFLAQELGVAGFGKWRLALSVLNYFELMVNSGLVRVVTKRIADAPDDSPRIERAAYLGQMILAAGLFAVALLAAGPIASALGDPSLAFLLRIAALDIPVVAAFTVATAILLGVQRFERQALGMTLYATAKFLAIGALVWLGFSVPGALIGNALASIVGFAVTVQLWRSSADSLAETAAAARSMTWASIPFLALGLIEGLIGYSGLWFVGAMMQSAVAIGLFGAAAALAEMSAFLFAGLHRALFSSVSRVNTEGDEHLLSRYAAQAVRLTFFVGTLGIALIAATGSEALSLVYAAPFAAGAVSFVILMIGAAGQDLRGTITEMLMATGRQRQVLLIVGGTVLLQVVLLAVLTGRYGLTGAAAAIAVAGTVAAGLSLWTVRGLLPRRLFASGLRSVLAAVPAGAALVWLQPKGLWLIPAYVGAGAVYLGALALAREFDADDVASLRAVFGGGPK